MGALHTVLGKLAAIVRGRSHERAYSEAVIALAAKLAKIDGPITRPEIDCFKTVFKVDPAEIREVGRIWRAAKENPRGFAPYARRIGALYAREPKILENMVAALFEVARADGRLKDAEIEYLRNVARALGLARGTFERIRMRAEREPYNPYAVLGVHPNASDVEIKQAWKRLLRVYHPDAVSAQGYGEERLARLIARATEKTAAINAAYEHIQRERVVAA